MKVEYHTNIILCNETLSILLPRRLNYFLDSKLPKKLYKNFSLNRLFIKRNKFTEKPGSRNDQLVKLFFKQVLGVKQLLVCALK